jgi:hypothetical protein
MKNHFSLINSLLIFIIITTSNKLSYCSPTKKTPNKEKTIKTKISKHKKKEIDFKIEKK